MRDDFTIDDHIFGQKCYIFNSFTAAASATVANGINCSITFQFMYLYLKMSGQGCPVTMPKSTKQHFKNESCPRLENVSSMTLSIQIVL